MIRKYLKYFILLNFLSQFGQLQAQSSPISPNFDRYIEQINHLKKISQKTSPDLKTNELDLSIKKANQYTAITNFLPHANLELKKQKDFFETNNPTLRSLGLVTPKNTWSLNYQWSLFSYNNWLNIRKSSYEKEKTTNEEKLNTQEYEINFYTDLLTYLLAKYKTVTINNSIKKAETAKKEAELGFKLGSKTKIDVLRSEANYVSLNSKEIEFKTEENEARTKFIINSGLSDSDLDFLNFLNEEDAIKLINALSDVTINNKSFKSENSLVLKNLKIQVEIEKSNSAFITSNEWPDLKLQGAYSNSADTFKKSFSSPSRSHVIALVLTIPIFSGGSLYSSNFSDYFQKKKIEYTIEKKYHEVKSNFSNTEIKINALNTMIKSLKLNVDQFEELNKLTLKSYQLGKSSLFELLEVQDSLLDAKINLAKNKIDFYNLYNKFVIEAGIE